MGEERTFVGFFKISPRKKVNFNKRESNSTTVMPLSQTKLILGNEKKTQNATLEILRIQPTLLSDRGGLGWWMGGWVYALRYTRFSSRRSFRSYSRQSHAMLPVF